MTRTVRWTHKSVLQLAGDDDPIEAVQKLARQKVLQALDAGWSGPPFNPVKIAEIMGIRVEPNGGIADAQTVFDDRGLRIEFNPTQPRERVRFSLAHEVAHALFEDVGEEVRHRGGPVNRHDDWQLETLCNVAAAEFVMPLGTLPARDNVPRLEELLVERRAFDVSVEAFLLRVTTAALQPIAMFVAAPGVGGQYRLEYTVQSDSWPRQRGKITLPEISIVRDCVAIGQTLRADERWLDHDPIHVECVGIPAHPKSLLPRVAGLLRLERPVGTNDPLLLAHGNVLSPSGRGPKIVCFLVNDVARTWGGGVARSASKAYPPAAATFSGWIASIPREHRLGSVFFYQATPDIYLAALVAQSGVGQSAEPRLRYAALEQALTAVAAKATELGASVHMPRLGAGAAGGKWPLVENIVRHTVLSAELSATVYDLPPARGEYSLPLN